jgi:hypothetical protein
MRYLLVIGLLVSASVAYAQVGPAEYAIDARDAAWLTKRGFPMDTYDWNNEAINQQLALAARYRRQSSRCWRYGGLSYLASSMTTFGIFIGTFGIPSSQRRPYDNAIYVATVIGTGGLVTALGGGIWRKAKARRRVRNALRLNNQ